VAGAQETESETESETETATESDEPTPEQRSEEPDAFGEDADARAERIEQEARTHFEAGRMAFADGRFEHALQSFETAFELSDRPVLLFNIGTSLDRLQRKREAIEAFERYLERVPDADNRLEVESRLSALREAVAAEEARAERLRQEEERRRALEAELAARDAESQPIYAKWWFWTIIGALVVGGVVTAAILAYDPGQEDPTLGTTGQVTFTLGGP
jgi:tetratricopeptide (TPR) repeat protein